jgi:tetratricopeptide (TPR) repeat protein
MKTVSCIVALVLLAILGADVHAADPRIGRYVKYDTGDFVIITSRGGAQARDIMQNLVKFRVSLERILKRNAARSGIPTQILITSNTDWEKYLQPRERVAGFFQRARFENYMAIDGDSGEFAVYIMFHEYTHFFLASQFAGEYPPWFNEGLAELMAYTRFNKKKNIAVLQLPTFRLHEARDSDWIPFDRLIRVDQRSAEFQQHKLAKSFYAQAWLTVHYGMLENRDFGRQLLEYLGHLNRLVPQDEAIQKAFGDDLGAIDAKLRDYSRKRNMVSGSIDLGDVPEVTLPVGVPLSDTDVMAAIIEVMLASRAAPDRTRPLVESLMKRQPDAARSHILAARLAEFEDDSAAFDAAVAKASKAVTNDDVATSRDLGIVLLASAEDFSSMNQRSTADTERDLKRALKWLVHSVERNNEDPKSLWGLGTVLTRMDKDLDLAESALGFAYQKAPGNASIALSLANLKFRQQKPDDAVTYLQDTIRFADNIGMKRWATDTLERTQEQIAKNKQVEEENRKQREAHEKQRAEYEKKYGKPPKKPATKKPAG